MNRWRFDRGTSQALCSGAAQSTGLAVQDEIRKTGKTGTVDTSP